MRVLISQSVSNGAALVKLVGNKTLYAAAKADKQRMLEYMKAVWQAANEQFFGSKLQTPKFKLKRDVDALSFDTIGHWAPNSRTFAVSPRLFNASQRVALVTLVHEQCHQAVSELDKDVQETHGPKWKRWMKRCGLSAELVDDDVKQFLTADERADIADRERRLAKASKQAKKFEPLSRAKLGTYVTFYDLGADVWAKGVLAAPHDAKGKYWAVVTNDKDSKFRIVPKELMYLLPNKDKKSVGAEDRLLDKCQRVATHYASKRK